MTDYKLVPCPACNAKPGNPCTYVTKIVFLGQPMVSGHVARYRDARRKEFLADVVTEKKFTPLVDCLF